MSLFVSLVLHLNLHNGACTLCLGAPDANDVPVPVIGDLMPDRLVLQVLLEVPNGLVSNCGMSCGMLDMMKTAMRFSMCSLRAWTVTSAAHAMAHLSPLTKQWAVMGMCC